MSEARTFIFEIYKGGQLIGEERLGQDVVKLGSHTRNHVVLDDPGVARVHAVIEVKGDDIWLIDLGSGRGTNLNGERVNKAQIAHKDRIQLGGLEIIFYTHDEKAEIAARQAHERAVAAAIAERRRQINDETLYSRRFLSRPASTDGSVEIAVLFRDFVMADEIYNPPRNVTIGSSGECDFPVEHPSLGEAFTVVEATDGSQPVVRFTNDMDGDVFVGTEQFSLRDAVKAGKARAAGNGAQIPLTQDTRVKLQIGEITIFIHRSTRPKLILPMEMGVGALALYIGISLVMHAAFLLLVNLVRPELGGLDMDGFNADDRFVQVLLQEEEEEPPPEEENPFEEEDDQEEAAEREAGDEGRAGDEREEDTDSRMAVEGDNTEDMPIELAMRQAREEASERGAVAVLNNFGPSSLFGSEASGYDDVMAIGNISDGPIGASYGTSGLGRYGGGLSGGGTRAGGGFGAGPIAVGGRSSGDGDLGRDSVGISRDRDAVRPSVVPGDPEIRGQLDREIIARVIREHRREIRSCYESQLQQSPDLEGRVIVRFTISPDGSVASASIEESDVGSSAVEDCVARRVRQWRFPEPRGGGIVRVSYPFVFTSG